jgi:hypothetical protein
MTLIDEMACKRRQIALLVGSIVRMVAHIFAFGLFLAPGRSRITLEQLPCFYYWGMPKFAHIVVVGTALSVGVFELLIGTVHKTLNLMFHSSILAHSFLIFVNMALLLTLYLVLSPMWLSVTYIFRYPKILDPEGLSKYWQHTYLFLPCSPQSPLDWDQMYGIVVGVVLLSAEVVSFMLKRRKARKEFCDNLRRQIDEGIAKRKAVAAENAKANALSRMDQGMETDDVELAERAPPRASQSVDIAGRCFVDFSPDDDDHPDAPIPFGPMQRADLEESFVASEDDEYVMSGARSGRPESAGVWPGN